MVPPHKEGGGITLPGFSEYSLLHQGQNQVLRQQGEDDVGPNTWNLLTWEVADVLGEYWTRTNTTVLQLPGDATEA